MSNIENGNEFYCAPDGTVWDSESDYCAYLTVSKPLILATKISNMISEVSNTNLTIWCLGDKVLAPDGKMFRDDLEAAAYMRKTYPEFKCEIKALTSDELAPIIVAARGIAKPEGETSNDWNEFQAQITELESLLKRQELIK